MEPTVPSEIAATMPLRMRGTGFSIIEAVIAAAVIALGFAGIVAAYSAYVRAAGESLHSVQAMLLAEEGLEATMLARDSSWQNTLGAYAVDIPYFFVWSGGNWQGTTTGSYIDGTYWRTVTFQSVYRNGSDEIVASPGTLDQNTLLATAAVSWSAQGATSTVTLAAYVSNLFNN